MTESPKYKDGDVTPGGSEIMMGSTREGSWTPPESYAENCELIEEHLKPFFGVSASVFHEIISDLVHLDVLIFEPTEDRDYWVYVTSGMGDLRMTLGDDLDPVDFGRAELILGLPRDWGDAVSRGNDISIQSDQDDIGWPIGLLKWLARYPHLAKTFFTDGHTIPNGNEEPYCDESRMNGALLAYSTLLPDEAQRLRLPDGDKLNFLGVTLLYPEEMDFKLKQGTEKLFKRLDKAGVNEVLDIKRQSVVRKSLLMRLLGGE